MHSHDFNGIAIEKGANWIEGVGGKLLNPIIPLAEEIGLINDVSNFDNTTNNIFDQKYVNDSSTTSVADNVRFPVGISSHTLMFVY